MTGENNDNDSEVSEGEDYEEKVSSKNILSNFSLDKIRENPWILSTVVLGLVVIIMLVLGGGGITGNAVSGDTAGQNVVDFIKLRTDQDVKVLSVEKSSGLYSVNFEIGGEKVPLFVTLDGKYLITNTPISLTEEIDVIKGSEIKTVDVPKSDKPVVELFVMTHCPYGTQAEKGFLPVIVALGDKIDASVKFTHFFLHEPEYDETPVQICIREEQGSKYDAYLKEFLVAGDTDAALKKAGVDKNKLEDCIANSYDGYYAGDSALSEGYGVRGSPTLVINGQIVDSGRSADAYLKTICSSFNDAPNECASLQLDSANPSAGFGYGTSSSIANAQC